MARHGWSLLKSMADFLRRFLLPAPATNCQGCFRQDPLRLGSSMQQRVLATLRFGTEVLLSKSVASLWTPHPARSFLSSATAALGVAKEQKDDLGGWSAEGSDQYTRPAARRITNLQKLLQPDRVRPKTLYSEAETVRQLDDHLSKRVSQELLHQRSNSGGSKSVCDPPRAGDVGQKKSVLTRMQRETSA